MSDPGEVRARFRFNLIGKRSHLASAQRQKFSRPSPAPQAAASERLSRRFLDRQHHPLAAECRLERISMAGILEAVPHHIALVDAPQLADAARCVLDSPRSAKFAHVVSPDVEIRIRRNWHLNLVRIFAIDPLRSRLTLATAHGVAFTSYLAATLVVADDRSIRPTVRQALSELGCWGGWLRAAAT